MRMVMAVREEVEEYGGDTDPGFAREVLVHAVEHVRAFVRAGRRGRAPAGEELDFVRARGAQRARELLPLDALLESYLIGQRTFWEAIVAAAGDSEGPARRPGADRVHLRLHARDQRRRRRGLPGREPRARVRGRARPPRPARPPALRPPARPGRGAPRRGARAAAGRGRRRRAQRARRDARAGARGRVRRRPPRRGDRDRAARPARAARGPAARRRRSSSARTRHAARGREHAVRDAGASSAAATSRPPPRAHPRGRRGVDLSRTSRSSTTWPRPPTRPPTCCSRPASTSSRRWPRRCAPTPTATSTSPAPPSCSTSTPTRSTTGCGACTSSTGRDPRRFSELVELTTALRIIAS